ncbi:Ig-like domain-containing protein [Phytoactinopolyspora endophytica]|uniref:Ig-like domain-containing protein n=1 Tax=Phytoactinopolyspora endophytica TaxID=1642495 RepID=UPI00101DE3B2|nr:Ig-like domain-containing protein [Phytoactinopolyspora endophytica]
MSKTRGLVVLLISAVLLLFLTAPQASSQSSETPPTVYVATDGDDSNDGSENQPFATLTKARDHVRTLIADGMTDDVQILVREGQYHLDEPLSLDESDSGRDGHTVRWSSHPGETAEIIGARPIEGTWEPTDDPNIQRIAIPEVADGSWRFDQIFVDGERRAKARFPNDGYLLTDGGAGNLREFSFRDGDLPEWPVTTGAQAVVWSSDFFADTVGVDGIDHGSDSITVTDDLLRPIEQGHQRRYFVQGFKEALDAPGEFHLAEGEGYLYYWPAEESLEDATVLAPTVDNVVEVVGSSPDQPVHDVTFENLHLSTSTFSPYFNETHGIEWNRPAPANTPGVVYLENARAVTVSDNVISNAGFNAVSLHKSAEENVVARNEMRDFGYHGVLLMGTISGESDDDGNQVYDNRGNVISDNHLHDGGVLAPHGGGVFIHQSGENVVEHNVVHDMPRYGIAAKGGRSPDFIDQLTSRDNTIRYNDVSTVMQDTDDAGGITLTTTGPGNLVESNRVHDITAPYVSKGQAYGIYLDNNTSHATVRNNLVHGIDAVLPTALHGPINAKGPHNTIDNNILVQNTERSSGFGIRHAQHGRNDAIDHLYTRNVMALQAEGAAFYEFLNFEEDNLELSDDNVIYNAADSYTIRGLPGVENLDDWLTFMGSRYDQNSVFDDPQFRDAGSGDYVLSPESPAFALGIEDIDLSVIGATAEAPFAPGDLARIHVTAGGQVSRGDVGVGDDLELAATARDDTGLLFPDSDVSLSFASVDSSIATVDGSGVVSGHAAGVTAVTVTADAGDAGQAEVLFPIYVGDSVDSIELSADTDVLAVDQQASLRTVAHTSLGTSRRLDPGEDGVTFSSDDESVATVDDNGTVTALQPGTATIESGYTSGSQSVTDTLTVTVHDKVLDSVLAGTETLGVEEGGSTPITVSALWSDGTDVDLSEIDLSYSSGDESVATVDTDGTLTGVAPGTATIRVTGSWNGIERHHQFTNYVVRDTALPDGWIHTDVGDWDGQESYVEHDDGRWVLNSNGIDAWGEEDRVTYAHQNVDLADYPNGFSVVATVESVAEIHTNSMAGLMIRDDLTPSATNVAPRIRPGGVMPVGYRQSAGGGTVNASGNPQTDFPATLKLTYVDGILTSSYLDGSEWVESAQVTVDMSDEVGVGIWNAAADPTGLSQAVFSDVQIVAEDPVPADPETRAELEREITVASAFHATSTEGDGDGEYPSEAMAELHTAIEAARSLLADENATQSQVVRETESLTSAITHFQNARVVPRVFTLDFEDDPVGQPPESVYTTTPDNGTVAVAEGGYDERQAMVIEGTETTYRVFADVPPSEADRTTYSMRFMPEQNSVPFVYRLGSADGEEQMIHLWFLGNGTIRLIHGDGSQEINIASYSPDQWYTVDVTADMTNKTFDLELDDEPIISDVPFRHPVESIETVEWRAGDGRFWIDHVTAIPVQDTDAAVESITVDGAELEDFDPDETSYVVELPPASPVPAVESTPRHPQGSAYVATPDEVPGTAWVVGISEDRTTHRSYEIEFTCGTHSPEETVVVGDVDSDVPNYSRADGCTFLDLVDDEGPFADHGELVRTVRSLAKQWYDDGILSRQEYQTLVMSAAQAGTNE